MAPLGPFDRKRRVAVGVSGGADSMALASLLARWGAPQAVIVDHGLRPGSAAEADEAAGRLAAIGVPARVARIAVPSGSGVSERARQARYAALLSECRALGCADLLLAHHAGDQAETVRMRQQAGSGPAGLAGMAAITYRDGARLLRPLLTVAPTRLRATLRQAGLAHAEDPTNRDQRFLRARLRRSMTAADVADALAVAAERGPARHRLECAIADELAAVEIRPEGYALLPGPIGPEALSALIWTLSGRLYPPGPIEWREQTRHGMVLARAGRLGAGWLLAREPAAVAPPIPARLGAHWDGRYLVTADPGPGIEIGALGPDAPRLRRLSGLPSLILRGLPAFRRGGELVAVPHLPFPKSSSSLNLLRLRTTRPAAGAPFAPAELVRSGGGCTGDAHSPFG